MVDVYTTTETTYPNMGKSEYHTGIKENTRTQTVNFVFKRQKAKDSKSKEEKKANSSSSNEFEVEVADSNVDTTAVEVIEITDTVAY